MTKIKPVFISHDSEEDGQFAHRLASDLKRLGVPVWIAPESIRPGEGWVDAINRGLEESSHVLVVLTPAAVESRWVKMETNVAIAQERQGRMEVIPLDVKPCAVPPLWSSYQTVSFRRDYDAGLGQLANMLGVPITPPEAARLPLVVPEAARPTVVERLQPFEPDMILIPAGEFLMGSDPRKDKDAYDDEQPQHTLYLPDYHLARTPVTNAQYAAFVQATGHDEPRRWEGGKPPRGKWEHPVVSVSWHDAVAYCRWLSEVTGQPYRLPSEAEWEKGARGSDGRIYPWGNRWDAKRCNSEEGGRGDTTPVGAYPQGASPYGLLDSAGNVWEWTRSLWGREASRPDFGYPYDAGDGREDLGAGDKVRRVVRGGSFIFVHWSVRCAARDGDVPDNLDWGQGFRPVAAPVRL